MQEIDVVAGVIFFGEKIILAQRKKGDPLEDKWEFPGGKIEKGETPQQALKREIKEELGIEIHPEKEMFKITHRYPDKTVHLYFVKAQAFEEPKNLDCQDVKLLYPTEIDDYDLAPADKKAWHKLKKLLGGCGL